MSYTRHHRRHGTQPTCPSRCSSRNPALASTRSQSLGPCGSTSTSEARAHRTAPQPGTARHGVGWGREHVQGTTRGTSARGVAASSVSDASTMCANAFRIPVWLHRRWANQQLNGGRKAKGLQHVRWRAHSNHVTLATLATWQPGSLAAPPGLRYPPPAPGREQARTARLAVRRRRRRRLPDPHRYQPWARRCPGRHRPHSGAACHHTTQRGVLAWLDSLLGFCSTRSNMRW